MLQFQIHGCEHHRGCDGMSCSATGSSQRDSRGRAACGMAAAVALNKDGATAPGGTDDASVDADAYGVGMDMPCISDCVIVAWCLRKRKRLTFSASSRTKNCCRCPEVGCSQSTSSAIAHIVEGSQSASSPVRKGYGFISRPVRNR